MAELSPPPEDLPPPVELRTLALSLLRELATHDTEIARRLAELGLDRDD